MTEYLGTSQKILTLQLLKEYIHTFEERLGDKTILSFDNAYSGFTPNINLEGFEAAGEDGIFYDVTAVENPQTLNIEIQSDFS